MTVDLQLAVEESHPRGIYVSGADSYAAALPNENALVLIFRRKNHMLVLNSRLKFLRPLTSASLLYYDTRHVGHHVFR